ncbi:MAG TPA: CehA/McbA family metallohydrolase [Candidatus Caenarcaniphilales bacterium]|nr:CehA/McbA family metallohydrolase [Candidatus Caenarcaniphilales bacterium]
MMFERLGRADLHIHSLASDGISSVDEILDAAQRAGLDVIAITDHERVDGAHAARAMARARGLPLEVVIGEEITTRSGHLLALFITERIPPWRSMRSSIARVHEQGGLAVVAHPLVPYPLCASARTIRRLLAEPDPRHRPDGIEAFNPMSARLPGGGSVPRFADGLDLATLANSDAHAAEHVGQAVTTFPGRTPEDLRQAILSRATGWQGTAYPWRGQLSTFARQQRKNAQAVRDEVVGKVRRNGTGRDLGYPGGRRRPARLDVSEL